MDEFPNSTPAEEQAAAPPVSSKRTVRILFFVAGCVCLALGAVGVVVPLLPSTPFFLLTIFGFAKSSERLYAWFLGTTLYRNHLQRFKEKRVMTWETKLSILIGVTAFMAVGFVCMKNVPAGRVVAAAVWVLHIIYFAFRVKTAKPGEPLETKASHAQEN